jgi:hypothetical protein
MAPPNPSRDRQVKCKCPATKDQSAKLWSANQLRSVPPVTLLLLSCVLPLNLARLPPRSTELPLGRVIVFKPPSAVHVTNRPLVIPPANGTSNNGPGTYA